jgi:hypothetical protein
MNNLLQTHAAKLAKCTVILLLSIFLTVAMGAAKTGGSNGGGANEIEGLFQTVKAQLASFVRVNKGNILSPDEKANLQDLINKKALQFDYSESLLDSEYAIQEGKVLLSINKLQKKYGKLNQQVIYEILEDIYSSQMTSKDAFQKIKKVVEANILVSNFLDFPNGKPIPSIEDNNGCRDNITMYADPSSGHLTLTTASSGTCLHSDWFEASYKNYNEKTIRSATLNYQCNQNSEKEVNCKLLTGDDFQQCTGKILMNLPATKWPVLTFSSDGKIAAQYFWCSIIENFIYKRSATQTYHLGSPE